MKTYEYKNENKTRTVYIDPDVFAWEKESLDFNDSMLIKALMQSHHQLDEQIVIHRVAKIKDQEYLFLVSTPSDDDPIQTLKVKMPGAAKGKLSKKDDGPVPAFAIKHIEVHEQMFETYKFVATLGVDLPSTLSSEEDQEVETAPALAVNLPARPTETLHPRAQIKNHYETTVKKCIAVMTLADGYYANIKQADIDASLLLHDLNHSEDAVAFQPKKSEINAKKLQITAAITNVIAAHQKTKFVSLELSKFNQQSLGKFDSLDASAVQAYSQRQHYEYVKRNLIWAIYTAAQLYLEAAKAEAKGFTSFVTDRFTGSLLLYFPNLFNKLINLNGEKLEDIESVYQRLGDFSFAEISARLQHSLFIKPGLASYATNYNNAYQKANEKFSTQFNAVASTIKGYVHLNTDSLLLDESIISLEKEVKQKADQKDVESLLVDVNSQFEEQVAFTSECEISMKAMQEEVKRHVVPVRTLQAQIDAHRDLKTIQEASSQSAAVMGAIIQGDSDNRIKVVDTADVANDISKATDDALQAQSGIRSSDPERVQASAQAIRVALHKVEDGSQKLQVISHQQVRATPAFPHVGKIATPISSGLAGFGIAFGIGWGIGLALGPATMGISVLVCAVISGIAGLLVFGGIGLGVGVLIDRFRNKPSVSSSSVATAVKPELTRNASLHKGLGVVRVADKQADKLPTRSITPPLDMKKTPAAPAPSVDVADSWVHLSPSSK